MRNFKIGQRLIFGFSILVILVAISSFNALWQVNSLEKQAQKVVELRLPTAQASASILNGVNHALAALRGWMILGKDKFKNERAIAWETEINSPLATLEEMSVNWTNPDNVTRLAKLKSLLNDFAEEQQKIEDIAQTVQNTPALEMLFDQAVPQATIMSKQITLMIDLEAPLESTPERKALLGMMADVRGTLGLALANIRGYLLSGEVKYKDNFDMLWAKNEKRFADLKRNKALFSFTQAKAFSTFASARNSFAPIPSKMLTMRSQKDWNLANYWLSTKAAPVGFQIKVILKEMAENQALLLTDDAHAITDIAETAGFISWIQLIVGLLLGIVVSRFVTSSIINPIEQLKKSILTVEKNSDLAHRTDTFGSDEVSEIAKAFNRMLQTFQQSLNSVKDASNQIASTSEKTSVVTEQTSAAVQQQQAETTLLATAMKEMSITVNDIASNTTQTSVASDEATIHVTAGAKAMQGTIAIIQELATVIETTSEIITELEKRTIDISGVLDVISGIAEQTNLLALNAAIEAARAGEQGRGFAVVADEVRALASRTQDATGEITKMIDQLQQGSKQAVSSMNASQAQVSNAVSQANSTGDSLDTIADVIHRINDMSSQIATAAEEQGAVAVEISRNVTSINEAAEQTASAASETSKSSHDLAGLASGLNSLVQRFKV